MPTLDLHQRIAVVTGGAQGIGRTIAERLLTAGAAACLWDRATEALTSTAHDLRTLGTVEAVTVDVTDPAAVSAAVQATRERFGGIDILVNNAGIAGPNHPLWGIHWRTGGRSWRSICWAPFIAAGPSCPSCCKAATAE